MPVRLVNPDGVFKPDSYFQASVATGSSIVCLSGQVSLSETGEVVGSGDLARQAEQVYTNIFNALKGVGASFDDIAKLTVFIPNYSPDKMGLLVTGATKAAQTLGFDPRKPITLVGVAALSSPELLVEIEALAVLSGIEA
jgi:enamine deaminase RidA (YjgF/YER057c/UK114 family)